jgi:pantoate--beta-alanine ligase
MLSVYTVAELRTQVSRWRAREQRILLVPTMGNLHDGHLQLVKRARALGGRIVVSVFVNPTQFAPGEDYATYPRTLAADSRLLENEQVDLLFTPSVDDLYPEGAKVDPALPLPAVADGLETDFRPGFFAGVATVVKRLFELVQPDVAVFGEKDYQQLAVVRALVQQLHWPIEIVGVSTVREADGLAMSSRNQYLSAEQRQRAPLLYRTLCRTAERLQAGEAPAALEADAMQTLVADGFVPDYVSIRRARDLQPLRPGEKHQAIVLAAARLGHTRLIDNVIV